MFYVITVMSTQSDSNPPNSGRLNCLLEIRISHEASSVYIARSFEMLVGQPLIVSGQLNLNRMVQLFFMIIVQ